MTDFEINIAIAEYCGWQRHPMDQWIVTDPKYPHSVQPLNTIPNYCADLNAMHEAESTLRRNGPEFSRMLLELVSEAAGPGVLYAYGSFSHVHAPARLRAEAFLRTLGKLEEVQG